MGESNDTRLGAVLRNLPSVSRVIEHPEVVAAGEGILPEFVVALVRKHVGDAREAILSGQARTLEALIPALIDELRMLRSGPATVINGTGVIVQTNLGRAPVSTETAEAMRLAAERYVALETRLDTGRRGGRGDNISSMMRILTGAERTLVVNNNAAAVLLVLSSLGSGGEVIVSRGELVEIGGGFRVPDVMRQSGVTLIEVGTTNRTYVADYERAITECTAAVLRVHASNFAIVGFTTSPSLAELAGLAHDRGLLALEDVGSGCLVETATWGLTHEPTLQQSVAAGVDVICASGDKLLGGPQAGLILGRADLVDRIARHPLARAVRADKTTLAGITATLRHYLRGDVVEEIPVWWAISRPVDWLEDRARDWQRRLGDRVQVKPATSVVGGGSLPGMTLPSWSIAIAPGATGADAFARRLRLGQSAVFPRIDNDHVVIDSRTVLPDEDDALIAAIVEAMSER